MEDLRIPISENELLKPNPNTLQKVIETFHEAFVASNKSDLSETMNGVSLPEYGEIYHEAVKMVVFSKKRKHPHDFSGKR